MTKPTAAPVHALILALALTLAAPAAAQRVQADLECRPAGPRFAYDCSVMLSAAGQPLAGAEVSVGADMPSMPMAHNVRPVRAAATGTPGEYALRLALEMHGEWAVKIRVAGPLADQVVLNREFDASGMRASRRAGASPR